MMSMLGLGNKTYNIYLSIYLFICDQFRHETCLILLLFKVNKNLFYTFFLDLKMTTYKIIKIFTNQKKKNLKSEYKKANITSAVSSWFVILKKLIKIITVSMISMFELGDMMRISI